MWHNISSQNWYYIYWTTCLIYIMQRSIYQSVQRLWHMVFDLCFLCSVQEVTKLLNSYCKPKISLLNQYLYIDIENSLHCENLYSTNPVDLNLPFFVHCNIDFVKCITFVFEFVWGSQWVPLGPRVCRRNCVARNYAQLRAIFACVAWTCCAKLRAHASNVDCAQ